MFTSEQVRIVRRAAMLRAQAKAAEEEADALLDSLGTLNPDNYAAGNYILQITPTKRFDARTAKENLTPEEFASTLATKPDSATAKKVLSPERYALAQKVYGVTRKIVEVTD